MGKKKRIVVFTGAGVSADSGIATFRDADGLWAKYRIEEVCTPEALKNNREKVIEFYNMRRKDALTKKPNEGHIAIAELEQWADVCIITQNVDDLHERAGSTKVLHLHGELMKMTSSISPNSPSQIITLSPDEADVEYGTPALDGSLLRPYIVWFGEEVPAIGDAAAICAQADAMVVIGTSLNVYPAAGLIEYFKGKNLILINRDVTPMDSMADFVVNDSIGKILGEVVHV